jgi:Ca2+-binding RTX toxin-like protein
MTARTIKSSAATAAAEVWSSRVPSLTIAAIRRAVLQTFSDRFVNLSEIRAHHYARNSNQLTEIDYLDVVTGRFDLVSDAKSALHRLNRGADAGNERNSKWTAADGGAEYVFRYVGGAGEGGFRLVTRPLNVGTFNFVPASDSLSGHEKADIYPWILWGNTPEDAASWTARARNEAYLGSIGNGVAELFDFSVAARRWGGSADDLWTAADRAELFVGRSGYDVVSYAGSARAVALDLGKGKGFEGRARGDRYSGVEGIFGSSASDIVVGDGGHNRLDGLGGRDRLVGRGGRDTIAGGSRGDTIEGGAGSDRLSGGQGADAIHGDAQDDRLSGDDGDDTLSGGGGRDALRGGGGDDRIDGGAGFDVAVFAGPSADYAIRAAGEGWIVDGSARSEGRDTVVSVEALAFSDRRIDTGALVPGPDDFAFLPRFTVSGAVAFVISVPDLDDDGRADLAVGGGNAVAIRSGADGALIARFALTSDANAEFGAHIAPFVDRDGDGVQELLVGGPNAGSGFFTAGKGAVYVLSPVDGAILLDAPAPAQGFFAASDFGHRALSPGDIDGDGVADILAATGWSGIGGYVSALSGIDGGELYRLGFGSGFGSGSDLAALGDIDGDGVLDVALLQNRKVFGEARIGVHSGRTGAAIHELDGEDWGYNGGDFVVVGDVDGDGIDDMAVERNDLVGDVNDDGSVDGTGIGTVAGPHPVGAYVFASVYSGRNGAELAEVVVADVNDRASLKAAGDFNGDGAFELILRSDADERTVLRVVDLDGETLQLLTSPSTASDYGFAASFGDAVFVLNGDDGGPSGIAVSDWSDRAPVLRVFEADMFV